MTLLPLRLVLSPKEQERFRQLGQDAAQAVGEAVRAARPQWSERELAGAVTEEALSRGIQPVVLLLAGEERIFRHRYLLPKARPLGRLCMAVICGRRQGLIANLTRLRPFGHPQARDLCNKVLEVEAVALEISRPGITLGQILWAVRKAYQAIGRPDAFEEHHQGGLAGYRPREVMATPGNRTRWKVGMAIAWNPSLPGAKVEDTFLVTEQELANHPAWPWVEVRGRMRPHLLCA